MNASKGNTISERGKSRNFLAEIANEIGKALINNPQLESSMVKHIKKVIQEAEEYGQYLRDEWKRAKETGLTQYDESKDENKWYWWTAYAKDGMSGQCVYFANDVCLNVQFYMEGKPKPDPLSYLYSMIYGCIGEDYDGLELLDYQFVLLSIIHDAQNWQAGRKQIYFNVLKNKTLSDRLCQAVWHKLESRQHKHDFSEVRQTIKTALQTIKVNVEPEPKEIVNELDNGSQSTRATAIRSAAAELEQIANNFENWAKKEHVKYIDPNGVKPPAFTLAQIEDWVNTYLLKQRLVAVFFNHPHLSYDKNSGLSPFLTTYERKEFHLIIDVFRLHMTAIATSLKELYDEFWEDVKYHIGCHERSKKVQQENILSIGESEENTFWHPPLFLDGTVVSTVKRLRHIAKIAKGNLETDGPVETGQGDGEVKDTYNIIASHVSLGDKAQHASRDITTQEPDKEKGGWGLITKISLILGIIVSLIVIFGAYNKYIRRDELVSSVPAIDVRLSNSSEETVIVAERGDFVIWLPGPDALHTMGKYEFRKPDNEFFPKGIFPVEPNEIITVMAHVMNESFYAKVLSQEDCDFSLFVARANAGITSTNSIAFTRETIGKYYIEADVGKE